MVRPRSRREVQRPAVRGGWAISEPLLWPDVGSVTDQQSVSVGYLVCASQRSGTQLLCTSLDDTGVAGHPPGDLFDVGVARYDDASRFLEEVRRAISAGTGDGGVCGQRMFWNGLAEFCDNARRHRSLHAASDLQVFERLLSPSVRFVWLQRTDKLRQAISFWRATAGGSGGEQWRKPVDPDETVSTPPYDRAAIGKFLWLLSDQDVRWRDWFDRHDIEPIIVTYEELLADRPATIGRVLKRLGLDPDASARIGPPRVERQADASTDRYVQMYDNGID